MEPKTTAAPLARSVTREVLDWDHVERDDVDFGKDVLGLSAKDRQVLGLSAPQQTDLDAPALGGAETALADVLARGGAVAPGKTRAERYVPSGAVGKKDARKMR